MTPTLHNFMAHSIDQVKIFKCGLGSLSEQDIESIHHILKKYRVFNESHNAPEVKVLIKFNAERIYALTKVLQINEIEENDTDDDTIKNIVENI